MVAKVLADRLSSEQSPEVVDHEHEAEIEAIAAWFEALPAEWQRYLDHEARAGQEAYGQA